MSGALISARGLASDAARATCQHTKCLRFLLPTLFHFSNSVGVTAVQKVARLFRQKRTGPTGTSTVTTPSNRVARTQEVTCQLQPLVATSVSFDRGGSLGAVRLLPMWLSSMCTMSSVRESKWSPQPANLQALEKKETAAMPVMVAVTFETKAGSIGAEAARRSSGENSWSGAVTPQSCVKNQLESDSSTGCKAADFHLKSTVVVHGCG